MYDVIPVTSPLQTDCGATCLKMLLSYYGIEVPLETLLKECNTRLIGCTGKDILRVARLHGLSDIKAFKMDAAELIKQDRPAIIHWKHCHWCVFCGMDDAGKVVICNPDIGRFGLDVESFCAMYSGIAIFNGDPVDVPEQTDRLTALEEAVVELADLTAAHDDAIVELAGLIGG